MAVEGKCNCGAIKVSIDDKVAKETAPMFCRCSNCRRQSGACKCDLEKYWTECSYSPVGTAVTLFPDAAVTISGNPKDYEDKTTDSGTVLHRLFCGDCGW